jgi:26S proteasome regulatory subunit N3
MPGERRNLRSNKESSSSTNGEKARSNSQSSSSKDKPVPTRTTSSKSKALPSKKTSPKEANGDQPQTNGAELVENGVNGNEDIDMGDDGSEKVKIGKDGEDEMTVVVPPPNSSKLSGEPGKDEEGDVAMENTETTEATGADIDPRVKAAAGQSP